MNGCEVGILESTRMRKRGETTRAKIPDYPTSTTESAGRDRKRSMEAVDNVWSRKEVSENDVQFF